MDGINPEGQLLTKVKRNEEISFNGRHYEVGLPWKEDCMPLSNNYGMCETRLRSLIALQAEEGSKFAERVPQNYSRSANKWNHRKGAKIEQ